MSYFAVCSFDLKNGSYEDYQNAYADLARIGFQRQATATNGTKIPLPTTTTAGEFSGTSVTSLRDDLTERVKKAFESRRFKSEVFIFIGGDWAWSHRTTG